MWAVTADLNYALSKNINRLFHYAMSDLLQKLYSEWLPLHQRHLRNYSVKSLTKRKLRYTTNYHNELLPWQHSATTPLIFVGCVLRSQVHQLAPPIYSMYI